MSNGLIPFGTPLPSDPAKGFQGTQPFGGGEGSGPLISAVRWVDEPVSCTDLTRHGKACTAPVIEGTETCVGHSRSRLKRERERLAALETLDIHEPKNNSELFGGPRAEDFVKPGDR